MASTPLVSVVIPTFRRPDHVVALVASLRAQTLAPEDFEVIVVDDASGDDTTARLDSLATSCPFVLRVERHATNRGAGAARNTGLRLTRSPFVAFTDDDCHPDPSWLERGLSAFDDEVGVVQGRTTPTEEVRGRFSQRIENLSGLFEACNVFYRRDALVKAGGFRDETGFFFHTTTLASIGEDTRAGWAVRQLGLRAVYEPGAHVRHDVVDRGFGWHVRYSMRYGHFAALARDYPAVRQELFWHPIVTRRRNLPCLVALMGVAAMPLSPATSALALPWLWARRPRGLKPAAWRSAGKGLVLDLVRELSLIAGSIRFRSPVL